MTNNKDNTSRLDWRINQYDPLRVVVRHAGGTALVADFLTAELAAKAVSAVNAHDDLVAALQQAEARERVHAGTLRALAETEHRAAHTAHAVECENWAAAFAAVLKKAGAL